MWQHLEERFMCKLVEFAFDMENISIPATDGYPLAATVYPGGSSTVVIGSAAAVPRRFYRHLASFFQEWGATVISFDYRGIGESRPKSLRGFEAKFSDWGLLDLAGVLSWAKERNPAKLFLMGHSAGGQVAALADYPVDAMATVSSQSGYWRLQGGWQKLWVCLHMHFSFPLLSHLFGYMPWSRFGGAEDMPKGAALEWARWCRDPNYLHGDTHLPLHLYQEFEAPILACSIADDDWGTAESVDAMMSHYPNVQRWHIQEERKIGHFGFFRPACRDLWPQITEFFDRS
jgi:predicted alpha/beta hydrolase